MTHAQTPMHFEQPKLVVLTVTQIAHGKLGVILAWKRLGFFFSEDDVTALCYWRVPFTKQYLFRSLMWVPGLHQHHQKKKNPSNLSVVLH